MAVKASARRRTALIASAVVLTVVTATSMAGAHEGDDVNSIHACVGSNGLLRVLSDPAQDCRRSETALHWTADGGDSGELRDFRNALLAMNNVSDLVDWSNLAHVPQWVQDGEVSFATIVGLPAWLQDGDVDYADLPVAGLPAWLQDGDVDYADLVGAFDLPDGSVTAVDLAGQYGSNGAEAIVGAVTGAKIADGAVEGRDLAAGAVTPDKVTTVFQSSSDAGSTTLDVARMLPDQSIGIPAAAQSAVMINAHAQLSCAACPSGSVYTVEYALVRSDGYVVGPSYTLSLSADHPADVVTVAMMDTVPTTGTHGYQLRLSATDGSSVGAPITASSVVVTKQVFGRP